KLKYDKPRNKIASRSGKKAGREHLRQALCEGFFCNVARRCSTFGKGFRTMDGHGTTVFIHPSSTLFGCEDQLDWIIFNDIICTSKIYVKTVCPIRYEWIKDLMPRLHEANAYILSGWTREDQLSEENTKSFAACSETNKDKECPGTAQGDHLSLAKRSTSDTIEAARQRYLERKRVRSSLYD
ncbi:probable ATP-dependent RNA helicase DHX40, partial [Actinia tenebrosa]|uniref:Probable ATP-dependent RNA helicase DHX40 n=1 Tax=Actinia tenebrosa TaxID=6105 RepID=A0A6P8H9X2_ACTTE